MTDKAENSGSSTAESSVNSSAPNPTAATTRNADLIPKPISDVRTRIPGILPSACSLFAIVMALIVLFGWASETSLAGGLVPGSTTMKPWTAVAFLLSGLAMLITSRSARGNIAASTLSLAVVVIGSIALLEYTLDISLIDRILFTTAVTAEPTAIPGRMAIVTAVNFVLVGFALLLHQSASHRLRNASQWVALLFAYTAFVSIAAYLYGADSLHTIYPFSTIAAHTAVTFFILAIGILFLRPGSGIAHIFLGTGSGGELARVLIPVALVAPIFLGWLRLQGELAGLYDTRFGLAIFACTNVLIFSILIWRSALKIERVDLQQNATAKSLTRSETKFRALALALSDKMWELGTPVLSEVDAPKWWTDVTGQTDEEVKNFGWVSAIHPDDRESVLANISEAFALQREWRVSMRILSVGGEYRHFDLVCVPIFDEKGEFLQWIGTANDMTGEKEAAARVIELNQQLEHQIQELETANADLASFSYSISHDLRAPLRALDGFSLALLEDYKDTIDQEGQTYLLRIRSASQRMSDMVDALLNLSRVTRSELQRTQVNLSAVASDIVETLRESDPSRNVTFVIEPDVFANGDAKMLRIVLENLLNNAWKFTSKKGSAEIAFGKLELDGRSYLYVRDNGAGFEMEYAEKLFSPFQRLHHVTDFEGSGIGLATVQRIIRRHGGFIRAEGKVDEGAMFYFSL